MTGTCRVCNGDLQEVVDLGPQPTANGFLRPDEVAGEFLFRLAVGICGTCAMVQLTETVPQELRYHAGYRYQASGSQAHRAHFEADARHFLATELTGADPFIVEIGCNDGVMLATIAGAGVRHLGVEPSTNVARIAADRGVRVRGTFFDEHAAAEIRAADGPADVIFGANTICHVAHIGSLLRGIGTLLTPSGVFVFEEPYLGTILGELAFDQIYDEHVFYFTATSVAEMAKWHGLELVDAERIDMHGGSIRYTLARPGARPPTLSLAALLAEEADRGLADAGTFVAFGQAVERIRRDLVALLTALRAEGKRVVGYGAPAKVTTVTNYCGIGTDLLEFVVDSTPGKQDHLVPGSHLPVLPPAAFADPYPDYAVLFAWNHAPEIMAKERAFTEAGGRWIRYVPDVHVVGSGRDSAAA